LKKAVAFHYPGLEKGSSFPLPRTSKRQWLSTTQDFKKAVALHSFQRKMSLSYNGA
jgi:hypothetical protein